ncbi:MAG: vitamin K epoxide reductase family protein [Desulfobacterales bacterium]|jgi:uncharacterized membrane protein/protein-disulfide isomerase
MAKTQSKDIRPLPFGIYFWSVVIITLVGFIVSMYLSVSHYRVYTQVGYRSFCAISRAINCDTVSQSSYSIFLNLPVPVWGVIGYGFLFLFLLLAGSKGAEKKRMWAIVFWISLVFSCYSVILALISTFLIQSYCIMCIVLHAVNLVLLFYAWLIRKRFSKAGLAKDTKEDIFFLRKDRSRNLATLSFFILAVIGIWIFYPVYWHFQAPPLSDHIPSGMTDSGHPWIGAESPTLEIMEFADYQCFQCKKMHFFLRQLVAKHTDKLRLIHRHYPMDHKVNPIVKEPFHEGSGTMALIAVAATRLNHFWPVNDYLFSLAGKTRVIKIKELALTVGLDYETLKRTMSERKTRTELRRDIWKGNTLKIMGTPAYVIDGQVYQGHIPPEIIRKGLR